jgi:hypothetical protein
MLKVTFNLKVSWRFDAAFLQFQCWRVGQATNQHAASRALFWYLACTEDGGDMFLYETSINFQWTIWRCIPENRTLRNYRCGNLKSLTLFNVGGMIHVDVYFALWELYLRNQCESNYVGNVAFLLKQVIPWAELCVWQHVHSYNWAALTYVQMEALIVNLTHHHSSHVHPRF